MAKDTITLGADVGGPDAYESTKKWFMPLRTLLAVHCGGPYSTEIDEFAFVLRIDGKICAWEFEGCDGLMVNRGERYITIDIGVPRSRWETTDGSSLAAYLVSSVAEGLQLMVHRLKQLDIRVDCDKLLSDFEVVRVAYLNEVARLCA